MFWTYAIILMFVFSTLALSLSALVAQCNERKQIEMLSSVADTVEEWTVTLQVEQQDALSAQAYSSVLQSWASFTEADIIIVNRDGDVFEGTKQITDIPDKVMDSIYADKTTVFKSDFNNFYENRVLSVSYPLHYKNTPIGAIVFNKSLPELRRDVIELLLIFVLSSLLSLLVAFVIIYIQAKKISKPIVQINTAAQKIARGDFSERVAVTTKDEIGQLASTFNFMASSIEKADANRQSFVSDVSHELRTPMTSITGFVEGMLDGTIAEDDRNDYLKIVRDESVRLTKLVNDMLEMSKMQSEEFKMNIAPFDINDLICSSLISLEKTIEERNADIEVDFRPEHLTTLGDKDQLKRVLINLIDNAMKFCIPGTQILIKTSVANGKAHVSISNIGEEIAPDNLKHLFDRFYKTDKSRERDRTGAGLGLSLVKNILRLHNQPITVKNTKNTDDDNYTTTFEFTLEVE